MRIWPFFLNFSPGSLQLKIGQSLAIGYTQHVFIAIFSRSSFHSDVSFHRLCYPKAKGNGECRLRIGSITDETTKLIGQCNTLRQKERETERDWHTTTLIARNSPLPPGRRIPGCTGNGKDPQHEPESGPKYTNCVPLNQWSPTRGSQSTGRSWSFLW